MAQYEEEKAIDDILTKGINDLYSYSRNNTINSMQPIKPILHRSNSSMNAIASQIEMIQAKVKGQEEKIHSIISSSPQIASKRTSKSSIRFKNNLSQVDLLKKTRFILTSKRKQPKRENIVSDKEHNMKVLQHETNMLWKEKCEMLEVKYEGIMRELAREKEMNKEYMNSINCLEKKKGEVTQLSVWQNKLNNINDVVKRQYDDSTDKIKYQNELIIKLNHQLHQLRLEFQRKSPIEMNN